MNSKILFFVFVIFYTPEGLHRCCCGSDALINEIVRTWTKRQERAKSLRISWTEDIIVEKGAWRDPSFDPEANESVPPNTVRFEGQSMVLLHGIRFRLENKSRIWSDKRGKTVPRHMVSVFDGVEQIRYWPYSAGSYPDATIRPPSKDGQSSDAWSIYTIPVMLDFRPVQDFNGRMDLYLEFGEWEVIKPEVIVDSRKCVLVRTGFHHDESAYGLFWLDIGKDFSIVKHVLLRESPVPEIFFQVEYEHKQVEGEWIPIEWKMIWYTFPGAPRQTRHAVVTSCELAPSLSSEFSRPDFKVGTLVSDANSNQRWIVCKGGERRMILPSEAGLPYEQLLNKRGVSIWFFLVIAAFLVAVLCVLKRAFFPSISER